MTDRSDSNASPCPPEVIELVDRFRLHADSYADQSYNETQVRREFIDPLFAVLGWDVDIRVPLLCEQCPRQEPSKGTGRSLIHEDAIKVGGSTKAPDEPKAGFRIEGLRTASTGVT